MQDDAQNPHPEQEEQKEEDEEERRLSISTDERTCEQLLSDLRCQQPGWGADPSGCNSRQQWEAELRNLRDRFFAAQQQQQQQQQQQGRRQQQAAALMDACTFDQLQTRKVRNSDGRLHHQVRFEVRGFEPNEVGASVRGRRLTVTAARNSSAAGYKELVRSVHLPVACILSSLTATVTSDSVLLIQALMDDEKMQDDEQQQQEAQQQLRRQHLQQVQSPTHSSVLEPQLITRCGIRLLRLHLHLGHSYDADEVSVLVDDRRLRVSARHEEKAGGRAFFREFQRECDLPAAVQAAAATAALGPDGSLVLEAPLRQEGESDDCEDEEADGEGTGESVRVNAVQ